MKKKRMIYYVILKTASYTKISNLYVHVYINRRSSYCQADEGGTRDCSYLPVLSCHQSRA